MAVSLRKYPYPYHAMLAVCSDLDETPDARVYFETARFLNTREATLLGPGVGLEIGNSLYCDMPPEQFCFAHADACARRNIERLVASGHLDCLHSFGDKVATRAEAEHWWNLLPRDGRRMEVWIDHAVAPSNLDPDIMKGQGAMPGSPCYHADFTLASGALPFVWKGRVTSLVAQNCPRDYGALFDSRHPLASLKTLAIEWMKGMLARAGSEKYAMHGANRVLRETRLPDGTRVLEFMRCNPAWRGVSAFETAREFHRVVTPRMLAQLARQEGCSVLYTHLGKILNPDHPFPQATCRAFELLGKWQRNGRILITTTRRLLGYCRSVEYAAFTSKEGKGTEIHLDSPFAEEDLQGLTFYVDDPELTRLFINGSPFCELVANPADASGRRSVSIPWRPLVFPELESCP